MPNIDLNNKIDEVELSEPANKTKLQKIHEPIMNWIKTRLKEKTTWRGIFTILAVAGISLSPELKKVIIPAGVSLVGLLEVIFKDANSEDAKK